MQEIIKQVYDEERIRSELYYVISRKLYGILAKDQDKTPYTISWELYDKLFTEDKPNLGIMFMSMAFISERRNNKAATIKFFNSAIEILDKNLNTKDIELLLLAHESLINIYSKDGKTDKATPHLVAYAKKRPEGFGDPKRALYAEFPILPSNVKGRGKSHHASVRFDVDKNGFTTNITPLTTINIELADALAEAIKKSRYAPAIKDGQPVPMYRLKESITIFTER
ncbi:energy transducer TonB [Pseudemcibacter aquimaris]|uniref:energy transducer TonB n=1 Tax=Pseudemcibacter aquimaris TaxID=2857064 RepID=UPI002011C031|nr:energy transducer TonB [Pseudemcibacter aquimaris]MCC3860090.1 energy transducer TonB [Pseudemcibacter aquimaris]WDU57419.1 energy transducer TonB [Pseudemcibacter aquimaris]